MAKGRESTAESAGASEEASESAELSVEVGGGESSGSGTLMELEFVRGLIEAVDGSGIDSLEITRAGTRIKISKTPPSAGPAPTYLAAAPQAAAPAPAQPPAPAHPAGPPQPSGGGAVAGGASGGEESSGSSESDGLTEITSPMVGTFYRAPAPDAPPYVEVGSKVSEGQTLCILEAMKLMNELEAEVSGEIREILVDNAEPVEYGQVLFRIEPSG
ncbi:MAG: acetyl-CoA carboxylase biotin carboxyl carrier protein [Candidatus Longimicrobiales bacterium M2_2A_002]